MENLEKRLYNLIERRKANNSWRVPVAKQHLIDFCSNDYLGFARSKELRQAIDKEYKKQSQLGATGSRLLTGHNLLIEQLEKQIAEFHKAPTALLFNSGYDANLGLMASITRRSDLVLYDELVHASIHDGMRLGAANTQCFAHNDLAELTNLLQGALDSKGALFVIVESVYSMDGDCAPLAEMAQLCEQYSAYLIVDEAHATGIIGPNGGGLVQKLGLESLVFARLHTFGKALGGHGAVVLGNAVLKDYLLNFARSLIYTTALPIHSLISIQQAYLLLEQQGDFILEETSKKVKYFLALVLKTKIKLLPSNSPIQSVLISGNEEVLAAAQQLAENGLDVRAIRYPTVNRGQERLRICLHIHNSKEEIERLVSLLEQL